MGPSNEIRARILTPDPARTAEEPDHQVAGTPSCTLICDIALPDTSGAFHFLPKGPRHRPSGRS
jgi:hypothetical protein